MVWYCRLVFTKNLIKIQKRMFKKLKLRSVNMACAAVVRQLGAKKTTFKTIKVLHQKHRHKSHNLINGKVTQKFASMDLGAKVLHLGARRITEMLDRMTQWTNQEANYRLGFVDLARTAVIKTPLADSHTFKIPLLSLRLQEIWFVSFLQQNVQMSSLANAKNSIVLI